MSEQKIPIPAMLYNAAVGGHVTNSQQIIDENLNREQNDINQETVGAVPYNSTTPNGMGRIVLKKTDNFKNVVEAQSGNTIFIIKYDFTLTGNVTIPANCVLQFDGGSISGEHTITGQNTGIEASKVSIFSQNITLNGIFDVNAIYPEWFGAVKGNTVDSADAIQAALNKAVTLGLAVEFDSIYKIEKAILAQFHTLIFNNTVFVTNVKRDFALSLTSLNSKIGVFCEIRGNVAFVNQDTSFEEINQTIIYPATSNIPVNFVENINISNVPHKDFTIQGAKVGDLVYIRRGAEWEFVRFSGEVIADNTVRIYVNNHWITAMSIEDTEIDVKIISGCCHGVNIGGSFVQTGHLRCVKYTGLSFGLGSGLDEECGIRYKAGEKVCDSTMNVNLYPLGGIAFRSAARNNGNSFYLSVYSTPYASDHTWPRTYAYIGFSLAGMGNVFNNLAVEGTYHDYAISLGKAHGNNLYNIYTEFITSETHPNGKPLYAAPYSSGNRLSYCYSTAIQTKDTKGLDNRIETKSNNYVDTDNTTINVSELNMLRDVTFEKGMLTSGSGQYGRWYSWGSNCAFSKVDGFIPFTKALRIDATSGRLMLQQRVRWEAAGVNDLNNITTDLCFSFWCRTNVGIAAGIHTVGVKMSNGKCPNDEQWHFIKCPVHYIGSFIQVDIRWLSDTQQTGYAEIFNPRLTIGSNTTGVIDDSVLHELDNHGTTRPINVPIGHCFLDETLTKPIWWNGTAWVDATGATV